MLDWPNEGNGNCACRFERSEFAGEAKQVEWCGLHSAQRNVMRDAAKALAEAQRYGAGNFGELIEQLERHGG